MKNKQFKNIDEEMIDKIISVAYGDASLKDRMSVFAASRQNENVRALLDEYRATAKSVHSLTLEECPEELINITSQNYGLPKQDNKSFFFDLYKIIFSRPLVSTVATVIVLAVMISSILFSNRNVRQTYSQQEIELANEQVIYALSIVKDVLGKSNKILKEDILKDKVAKPIGDGINYVNTLLTEEK